MKKFIISLMASCVAILATAELREDAFIIRTTDGASQGLLFSDVEKITFSNLDNEGIPHSDIYYQELHFPDTIIRIPVTDIREVSFEKPRAIYKPNVILCEENGLFDYLWSCTETETGHSLVFDGALPPKSVPQTGQILTYFDTDNQILGGPFAGKVKSVDTAMDGPFSYIVVTEMVERIQDIYAELVGVEAITNDSPGVRECLRRANALPKNISRADGEGKHSIDFDVPLKYSYSPNADDEDEDWMGSDGQSSSKSFSVVGGIKGSLELRLAYEFSSTRNFLSVGTTYEYTPYFSLGFAAEATWLKRFWNPTDYPIFDIIVASAPIFSVSFGVAPFVKLSGSAKVQLEKTFPKTCTRTLAYYNDGIYRSSKCNSNNPDDKNVEDSGYELSLSLEGSAMAGVNMGMFVGTTRILKTGIGIVAEAFVGPKLSGTVGIVPAMPDGSPVNTVAYDAMKLWNISASWCAIDLSLSFYREVLGKPEKTTFAEMSLAVDPFTVSLVPSFEAPTMTLPAKDEIPDYYTSAWLDTKVKVSVPRPVGSSLLPIHPGCVIYDEDGKYQTSIIHEDDLYWLPEQDKDVFDNMEFGFKFHFCG